MITGLLFGTFDELHEGHRVMLREARTLADHLTVVLPPDDAVATMKGHAPVQSWTVRAEGLRSSGLVEIVIEGDREMGTYTVLNNIRPNIIFVGYDQQDLAKDLERYFQTHPTTATIRTLTPYQPERYKSSILRNV